MCSYNCCDSQHQEFDKIANLSTLLKLISEESRLKILCILLKGKRCVCEILKELPYSQSLTSHHLKDLKAAGIVHSTKKGQFVYYSLSSKGENIAQILLNLKI